jgi:hypothetical protein
MSDNKYKMFSNYMHNELGITKEDIHIWIKEAVEEIALKMTKNEFDKFSPERVVQNILFERDYFNKINIQKNVIDAFAKQLSERTDITFVNKELK